MLLSVVPAADSIHPPRPNGKDGSDDGLVGAAEKVAENLLAT
jgi:hypothetical protein